MNKVNIREFESKDEDWIRDEWKKSQLEYFGRISQDVLNDTIKFTENVLETDLLNISEKWKSPSLFLVAEDHNSNLVGTIAIKLHEDNPKLAEIQRLFVALSHRGKGIASQLVDYCENFLTQNKNIYEIQIKTSALQVQAANMYLRRGYQLNQVTK